MGIRGAGQLASEDVFDATHPTPRKITEETGNAVAASGVNVSYVRLPQVHDTKKQGLISPLVEIARAKGRVAYVGEGRDRWPAAHVSDVAHL